MNILNEKFKTKLKLLENTDQICSNEEIKNNFLDDNNINIKKHKELKSKIIYDFGSMKDNSLYPSKNFSIMENYLKAFKKRIKNNNSQNSSKNKEANSSKSNYSKNNSFFKKRIQGENIKKFKKLPVPKISKNKKVVKDSEKFVEKLYYDDSLMGEKKNIDINESVSIKNFDIEKNRTIKKILNLGIVNNNNGNNKNNDNQGYKEEIKKIKEKEAKLILRENDIFGKGYQSISLSTGFLNRKNLNENIIDKLKINSENRNIENKASHDENLTTHKDKNAKRKSWIEKSSSTSGVIQNLNSKINSKKYLPKIKYNSRKHSSSNSRQGDITFNSNSIINCNNSNINALNKVNNKTLNINKLIINFKDKSPEKKCNLRSINHNRLPSANSSKIRECFNCCSLSSNMNTKNIFTKN